MRKGKVGECAVRALMIGVANVAARIAAMALSLALPFLSTVWNVKVWGVP